MKATELRELAAKATPGPWIVRQHVHAPADARNKALDRVKVTGQIGPLGSFDREDGELIVALRNNLPAILSALEAVEGMREALEKIAAKNDLSQAADDEIEVYARSALYECELIARQALALKEKE